MPSLKDARDTAGKWWFVQWSSFAFDGKTQGRRLFDDVLEANSFHERALSAWNYQSSGSVARGIVSEQRTLLLRDLLGTL